MKKRILIFSSLTFSIICAFIALYFLNQWNILPCKSYSAEDFGIEKVTSPVDYNENGTDDYTDFLLGAKMDAHNKPTYDGRYWDGGYPPDDIGVCTDVIWRAFKQAGYSLRDMVDKDIKSYPERYPGVEVRDSNIDFRRLKNLSVFFEQYAVKFTLDTTDIAQWQPGDIVIVNNNHIGMVSDLRNADGRVYIIHNAGQPNRDEDALKRMEVTAHYRFDTSLIDSNVLVSFSQQS